MTRWLIAGAAGMLGRDLQAALKEADVVTLSHADLDVTDPDRVVDVITQHRPDVVVNCAAWTDVDGAETHEPDAFEVNAVGAANLARACGAAGARLVQISTDYVFDGSAMEPYAEDAPLRPRSAYGRTKAAGEWAVRSHLPRDAWIVRTAWLYGSGGSNFVKTVLRLEDQRDTIAVVDDQRGQPTWSADVARQVTALVTTDAPAGIYHATASGSATWFELARTIFELLGADPERVRPTTTEQFPRPARRPRYSVLGHGNWARAGLPPLPPWRESLVQAFPALRRDSLNA